MPTHTIRITGPNLREGVLVDLFLALLAGLPAAVLARCACGMIVRLYAHRGTTPSQRPAIIRAFHRRR